MKVLLTAGWGDGDGKNCGSRTPLIHKRPTYPPVVPTPRRWSPSFARRNPSTNNSARAQVRLRRWFFLCVCVRLFEAGERGRGGEASLQSCCCCCAIDALGRGHGYWPAAAARVAAASSRSQPAATATTGAGARAYMRVQEGRESSCSSTRTRRRQRSPLLTRRSARRMRSTHASIPLHTHTQHAPAAGFAFPVLGTAPLS